MPVKGSDSQMGAWAQSKIRTMPEAPFNLTMFSDFQLKRALYIDHVRAGTLVLPAEADNDLIHGLSGQEMVRLSSGRLQWKKVDDDHFGDAIKFSILAQWMMASEFLS